MRVVDSIPVNIANEHITKQFKELIDACFYELYFEQEVEEIAIIQNSTQKSVAQK